MKPLINTSINSFIHLSTSSFFHSCFLSFPFFFLPSFLSFSFFSVSRSHSLLILFFLSPFFLSFFLFSFFLFSFFLSFFLPSLLSFFLSAFLSFFLSFLTSHFFPSLLSPTISLFLPSFTSFLLFLLSFSLSLSLSFFCFPPSYPSLHCFCDIMGSKLDGVRFAQGRCLLYFAVTLPTLSDDKNPKTNKQLLIWQNVGNVLLDLTCNMMLPVEMSAVYCKYLETSERPGLLFSPWEFERGLV